MQNLFLKHNDPSLHYWIPKGNPELAEAQVALQLTLFMPQAMLTTFLLEVVIGS